MRFSTLASVAALGLSSAGLTFANPSSATKLKEESIATELRRGLKCESMPHFKEGGLYCSVTYRGLSVEFAGVNAPGGGSVYVHSMGKNQTLTNLGRRCLLVIFSDPDLKPEGIGAHVILRDDATFASNFANPAARKACD